MAALTQIPGDVDARENLDVSPRIMIEGKKGEELRKKIDETREKLIGLLDAKEQTRCKLFA